MIPGPAFLPETMPVDTVEASFATAVQFHQGGHVAQAEQVYRQILLRDASHADSACNLGVLLAQQGRLDEAIGYYHTALSHKPEYPEAYFNLGNALRKQGRFAEAAASYHAAVRLRPDHAGMFYNLGLALVDLGRLDDALACFQQALRLEPGFADVHNRMGDTLQRKGRPGEAAACFRQFLQLKPNEASGYNNLAMTCMAQGKAEEAVQALEQALRLKPDYALAHNNLAIALGMQSKEAEAIPHYQEAIRLKPDFAEALNNLANTYTQQGKLDEAIDSFQKSLALQPNQAHVHSNLLLTMTYHPRYDPAALLAEHRRWARQHAEPLAALARPVGVDRPADHRLRIGYVSADFRDHTVASVLEPILASHDHGQFQVFCYANVVRPDAVTERMRGYADQWRSIVGVPDDEVAAQIQRDAIDILVDLSGHTAGNRLLVFARKPAPVQVHHLGYLNTTGLPAIDYRFSDPHADPPGKTEQFYTEKLVRLPEIAWCYRTPAAPEVGELPARKAGHVTFGCLNNPAKVTPEVIALWSRLLTAVPGSRLLLTGGAVPADRGVQETFARHGIGADRITLMPRRSKDEYFALYNTIDIGLDPFPYNGGVTTCDALWMGVPVVTLAGTTYASRQGVTLLTNLELKELIAQTPEEYVTIATRLAGDLGKLATLRAGLRERMKRSPVTDAVRFTRHLETAYRDLWEGWAAAAPFA